MNGQQPELSKVSKIWFFENLLKSEILCEIAICFSSQFISISKIRLFAPRTMSKISPETGEQNFISGFFLKKTQHHQH